MPKVYYTTIVASILFGVWLFYWVLVHLKAVDWLPQDLMMEAFLTTLIIIILVREKTH